MVAASPSLLAAPASAPPASVPWIAGMVTIATLLLVGWVAFVWWIRSLIVGRLKELTLEKTRNITSASFRQISVRRMMQLVLISARVLAFGLMLTGLFVWTTTVLDVIPATHRLALQVEHSVYLELQTLGLAVIRSLPGLGVVALVFFATKFAQELLNHYFRSITAGELESKVFDPVTAETTRRIADLGLWIAAVIIAYPYIPGSESAAFRGVSVLAGLMLSLGSANLVSQFAAGLSLIYGRAVRPGEFVETSTTDGVVEHIGLFACSLRTQRDELVVLPHTAVAAGLKNFSREATKVRFTTEVTIGYDAPWRQVRDLLLGAAADTEGIRREPAPAVRQAALEDFYVRYELQFTPENPAVRNLTLGRLHEAIQDRFHAAGVQIMSPHYNSDPAAPKLPPSGPAA
jgi:small-conductance mechanosensitive channel